MFDSNISWLGIEPKRCWKEDYHLENGQYTCTCYICRHQFVGHKGRFICKTCDKKKENNK